MMPTWKTHMSEKEAIQMYDSGWWQDVTDEEILDRQLFERRTIMPFGIFFDTLERYLNEPLSQAAFECPELLQQMYLAKKKSATRNSSEA